MQCRKSIRDWKEEKERSINKDIKYNRVRHKKKEKSSKVRERGGN
jgi:hypothetical protein